MGLNWLYIVISVLVFLLAWLKTKEPFSYLDHKTKSFDAEKEAIRMYGVNGAWKAQPSKSYSAEAQGVAQNGLEGGFVGKTLKYY